MPTYHKLVRGSHTRWEGDVIPNDETGVVVKRGAYRRYKAGVKGEDVMEGLTKEEVKALGNRVQLTSAPKTVDAKSAASATDDEGHEDFADLNAADAIEQINKTDDVDEVKALKAVEEGRDTPRKTVLAAADKRIDELS